MKNGGESKLSARKDFEDLYSYLCSLCHTYPLPAVRAHLKDGVVDINGDIIALEDWQPIVEALKVNKTLNFVAIRSSFVKPQLKTAQNFPTRRSAWTKLKSPALHNRDVTKKLCTALKELLTKSKLINFLELQGIPLQSQNLHKLSKGLSHNCSLQHLSLENCHIGDEGFEIIIGGLKGVLSITSINLINNCLTSRSVEIIAELIKYQSIFLRDKAWQESLRYRQPNIEQMTGLRRITLNDNPGIGDKGATMLVEALRDDYWIKALDLQNCGIGNDAARMFLDLAYFNHQLVVLDLRGNAQIGEDLINKIIEQLSRNTNGKDYEYKWIKWEIKPEKSNTITKNQKVKLSNRNKRCHTACNIGYLRRSYLRPAWNVKSFHKRCLSSEIVRKTEKYSSRQKQNTNPIPWRVDARLQRYRGYPQKHSPGKLSIEEKFENTLSPVLTEYFSALKCNLDDKKVQDKDKIPVMDVIELRQNAKGDRKKGECKVSHPKSKELHFNVSPNDDNIRSNMNESSNSEEMLHNFLVKDDNRTSKITATAKEIKTKSHNNMDTEIDKTQQHILKANGVANNGQHNKNYVASVVLDQEILMNIQELKIEVIECRRRLELEAEARKEADHQIINLTLENNHLRQQLQDVFRENSERVSEDDILLESVEKSFQQFHAFLDYLHDVGFGSLIAASGLRSKLLDVQQASARIGQSFQFNFHKSSFNEWSHFNTCRKSSPIPPKTYPSLLKHSSSPRRSTPSHIKSTEIGSKELQNFFDLQSCNVSDILSSPNKAKRMHSVNCDGEPISRRSFDYDFYSRKFAESPSPPQSRKNSPPNSPKFDLRNHYTQKIDHDNKRNIENDNREVVNADGMFKSPSPRQISSPVSHSKLYTSSVQLSKNESSKPKMETINSCKLEVTSKSPSIQPPSRIPVPKPESTQVSFATKKHFLKNENSKNVTKNSKFETLNKDFVQKSHHKETEGTSFESETRRNLESIDKGPDTNYNDSFSNVHSSYSYSDNSLSFSTSQKGEKLFTTEEEF